VREMIDALPLPDAFNSLSRDHLLSRKSLATRGRNKGAFNSLSRDHGITRASLLQLTGFLSLSTPSLGITSEKAVRRIVKVIAFNSLSRDHQNPGGDYSAVIFPGFQLPLSGSLCDL